jgi:hypothetical protein
VWELFVTDDCNTDGEVGNKEYERLSEVVCNPTSTAITVQYVNMLSLVGASVDGVWIGEWIDHLYTQLETTSNYSAIANLHNSQNQHSKL